jgi:hypothetical protein
LLIKKALADLCHYAFNIIDEKIGYGYPEIRIHMDTPSYNKGKVSIQQPVEKLHISRLFPIVINVILTSIPQLNSPIIKQTTFSSVPKAENSNTGASTNTASGTYAGPVKKTALFVLLNCIVQKTGPGQ